MFDVLSKGFKAAKLKLQGRTELTEDNLADALREVRTSLIQADVSLKVAKNFVQQVKERSLGKIVPVQGPMGPVKPSPQDWFVKACYDEMVDLMGPVDTTLDLSGEPAIIMLVGLQGSGKTTTAGKLAKRLIEEDGKKPLLVAADVYRPAAVDQLQVLGGKLGVTVFTEAGLMPVDLAKKGVAAARAEGADVVIIDTAGRLAIDNELMDEVVAIRDTVKPNNVLFVCDAMIGQDAVRTANEFDRRLDFHGFILTKLDGDARGGAALSIKEVTGKPIKFLGQGEELDRLEVFRPEGLAQRILGFGDVVGLMQDFEKHVDQQTAETDAVKLLQGEFSYDDFVRQLNMVRRMGPLKSIIGRMPGFSGIMDQLPEEAFDDRELDRTMAIIQSMTNQERNHPSVMNDSRFARIARGCGRSIEDVSELHQRFIQAREMMKGLGSMLGGTDPAQLMKMAQGMQGGGGMGGLGAMGGFPGMPGMPGMGGPAAPPKPELSKEEKLARRKKQKAARKARKRNRK